MIYTSCRISCKDILNHFLQDILQDIPSAAGKFQLGTRCSPVALHPAYRSHLRPGFCALNEAGGFSKRVPIPHSQGPVRPPAPNGPHQRTGGFTFCTFCTYGALFQGAHPRSQEQVCRLLGPVFLLLFLMYGGINEIRKFACLPVLRQ